MKEKNLSLAIECNFVGLHLVHHEVLYERSGAEELIKIFYTFCRQRGADAIRIDNNVLLAGLTRFEFNYITWSPSLNFHPPTCTDLERYLLHSLAYT